MTQSWPITGIQCCEPIIVGILIIIIVQIIQFIIIVTEIVLINTVKYFIDLKFLSKLQIFVPEKMLCYEEGLYCVKDVLEIVSNYITNLVKNIDKCSKKL